MRRNEIAKLYWRSKVANHKCDSTHTLSFRCNGHFPGGPGLAFIGAKGNAGGDYTEAIRRAKLQSKYHHQQTSTQFSTVRMPFLSLNQ